MKCEKGVDISVSEALEDWLNYYSNKASGHLTGALFWICDKIAYEDGLLSSLFHTFTHPTGGDNKLCFWAFPTDLIFASIGVSVSIFIVIANEVLSSTVDKFVNWIGKVIKHESRRIWCL